MALRTITVNGVSHTIDYEGLANKPTIPTKIADLSDGAALASKVAGAVSQVEVGGYSNSDPSVLDATGGTKKLRLTVDTEASYVNSNGYVGVLGRQVKVKGIDTAAFKAESYFAKADDLSTLQSTTASSISSLSSTVSAILGALHDAGIMEGGSDATVSGTTVSTSGTVSGRTVTLDSATVSGRTITL